MHYFQLILTTALEGRKAGVLVLVFINDLTEGPVCFTDETKPLQSLGRAHRVSVVKAVFLSLQVSLPLRSQLGQGCLFSLPPEHGMRDPLRSGMI